MENLTQEEIQNSINAAYDSVNLINELNLIEELSDEQKNKLKEAREYELTSLEKQIHQIQSSIIVF